MVSSINNAVASASSSYASALKDMGTALTRLSSGKRFQTASEDIGGYLKVNAIKSSTGLLESSQASINTSKGFLDVAAGYASNLMDQLQDLKTAAFERDAAAAGAETVTATAKYAGILASISETLDSEYNGNALNPAGAVTYESVRMGNGGSLDLAFLATDGVTEANLAYVDYATTAPLIDAEIAKVASFAGKVSGYSAQVDAQESFVNTMLENYKAAETSITAINEAAEMADYVSNDIRQQSALAMMSQANMSRGAILTLYR